MADTKEILILTQLVTGDWTVGVVTNLKQAEGQARSNAMVEAVKQCVAVPVELAAIAPKMAQMLKGHNDPQIDELLLLAGIGEVVAEPKTICEQCESEDDQLKACSSCRKMICKKCHDLRATEVIMCRACADSLAGSAAIIKKEMEKEDGSSGPE